MKKKVLIVEDEALYALDLSLLLEDPEYDILEPVSSGEEALEAVRAESPDIVLMDINLSGKISGVETAKKISAWSPVPFIFMSGYPENELSEAINIPGEYLYLTKPVDLDELHAHIRVVLGIATESQ